VAANERKILRCAVYTRKSSEHGLEQDFNSLDAQREAGEAFIKSQAHEGWKLIRTHYDDGGLSGGTLERPALQSLLTDIRARRIDVVVVYKVDRLTRSLADFAKLVELFEAHGVSFVSVTQQFNTTTSMGRLTLNVLLSFAQFEREVAGERIRDKFAASRRKGMWMGGTIPLGYDVKDRKLIVNEAEAETVRLIFRRYLAVGCVSKLQVDLDRKGIHSKERILTSGQVQGGCSFGRGALYHLLRNRIYRGEVVHKGAAYRGEHKSIVDEDLWNAVQVNLSGDIVQQRQARIESGALLTGLIFDNRGNRMTSTYTVRRRNHYRYYVSRGPVQDQKGGKGALPRVAADDVERAIVQALACALSRDDLATDAASGIWSPETRTVLRESVERIVVSYEEIQVILKRKAGDAGTATVGGNDRDAPTTILKVLLPGARPRARKEILIPGNCGSVPRHIDKALMLALARARSWMRGLRQGEYADTAEIGRRFSFSNAHVRRLLRFAYLAPDILEAIVDGRQPRSLTVRALLRSIPLAWSEQRTVFGLTSSKPIGFGPFRCAHTPSANASHLFACTGPL
jgi:site-specific DNA recombinase